MRDTLRAGLGVSSALALALLSPGCLPEQANGDGSGGASSGSGGAGAAAQGSGGAVGSGGAPAGSGGSIAGSGGAATGSGGRAAGTGGGGPGTGGSAAGSGGSAAGTGGGGAGGRGGRGGGGSGGAAAGSGGAVGGGGAAGLGGPSLCAPGRFLLCEGFEGTAVGNTPPAGWTRTGSASVADDQAARGARAMKLAAATNGPRRFVYGNSEAFGAAHWGRIFYRVQLPVPAPFVHSTMVSFHGDGPGIGPSEFRTVDTVKMEQMVGTHQFLYNVQIDGSSEFAKGSPYNWRFDDAWHCAEWFVDGANQAYRFFIDGAEVTQIALANGAGNYGSGNNRTHLPMVFTEMRVGWNNYQEAAPGFVAWIDEIAVDASRVGCGN
jgi:hypothetical protein